MRRDRRAAAKVVANRAVAAATARRVARAATAALLIDIAGRSVGRSIRLARMIVRRATHATGDATGIGIRSDTRRGTSATARTMGLARRVATRVRVAAAAIAAMVRAWAQACATFVAWDLRGTTITTSIQDRRLLRRRIRITRCVVHVISCWVTRLRLGLIKKAEGGVWKAEGRSAAGRTCKQSERVKGFTLHQPPSAHGRARAAGFLGRRV
jgi:hypothetical protein